MTNIILMFIAIILLLLLIGTVVIAISVTKLAKTEKLITKTLKKIGIVFIALLILFSAIGVTYMKKGDVKEVNYKEITLNQYFELYNGKDKSIVLIARPTCEYCKKFTPVLKQAMGDLNLEVNYLNTDLFTKEDWEKLNNSNDFFKNDKWGTPLLLIIQKGNIIDVNHGYVDYDTVKEFFNKNGLKNNG
ncbi:MAG: hypothetical protein RSB54_02665 [Bacilli bacterium]